MKQQKKYLAQAISLALSVCAFQAAALDVADDSVTNGDQTATMQTTFTGKAVASFTDRGDDEYRVGYFVKDGKTVAENSLLTEQSAQLEQLNLAMNAQGAGFSAVIAHGEQTDLTLTGKVEATGNDDGENGSDFSGLGAVVVAADNATVKVENMTIETKGFVRSAFIVADGANMTVEDSTVTTWGANPLSDLANYQNNANISKMVSPPWVLGIQGGVRAANILGSKPTMSVINSTVTAGGWGVLSIDGSQSPVLNVVDSDLHIKTQAEGGMPAGKFDDAEKYGSGYGTYIIGNATQNFYGVDVSGATYASIFTGGQANFASSNGDITLKDANGSEIKTLKGKGRNSKIDTVWGFMSHRDGVLNVTDNTEINSAEATFLYKSGNLAINFDNAKLNTQSGVILQMIDNDDAIVGASNAVFNTEFNEKAGWPSQNGQITSTMPKSEVASQGNHPCQPPTGAPPQGMPPQGEPPEGVPPQGQPPAGAPPQGQPPQGQPPMGNPPEGCPPPPHLAEQEEQHGDNGTGTVVGADGQPLNAPQMGGQNSANVTFKNGDYHGNLYNGTGYYGQQAAPMSVTIGENATLRGEISLTETRHVNEKGEQNTHFTISEYYYLGHVENHRYRNGDATASVTLDGGTWQVTGENLLTELTLKSGKIIASDKQTVTMTVDGKATKIKAGTYQGDIVIALEK